MLLYLLGLWYQKTIYLYSIQNFINLYFRIHRFQQKKIYFWNYVNFLAIVYWVEVNNKTLWADLYKLTLSMHAREDTKCWFIFFLLSNKKLKKISHNSFSYRTKVNKYLIKLLFIIMSFVMQSFIFNHFSIYIIITSFPRVINVNILLLYRLYYLLHCFIALKL